MSRFDTYSQRARIAPVLLVVLPLLTICLFAPKIGAQYSAIPIIFVVAAAVFAEEIVRFAGKGLESKLAERWDGMPTVRALRYGNGDEGSLRDRRRREVIHLSGVELPNEIDERSDPKGADQIYDDAIRRCLSIVRRRQPKSMLGDENARYGFRRNMLGVKPLALGVIVIVVGADLWLGLHEKAFGSLLISGGLLVADSLAWTVVVTRSWVREQSITFAQRFFITIGTLD
jgi:drug/metabolite transporter superfamily protein YnfA